MSDTNDVITALFEALDMLNDQLPQAKQLEKKTDTILTGDNGNLDSLGLINFIVAIEQVIEDKFNKTITLTDEQLLADTNGPFHTLGSLAEYISSKIQS